MRSASLIKKYGRLRLPFNQPTLTSEGVMGVSDFAVSTPGAWRGAAYTISDNSVPAGTDVVRWSIWSNATIIFSKKPINVTRFLWYNGWSDAIATAGVVYACNDGSSYLQVGSFSSNGAGAWGGNPINLSSNNGFYNYYKIIITSANNSSFDLAELRITATYML